MRLLLATHLAERSRRAFDRACRIIADGGELRLVHFPPVAATLDERRALLHQLREHCPGDIAVAPFAATSA